MDGWVKLHRKLAQSDLWLCEPFTRAQAWVDIILLANHKQGFFIKRGIKVTVERGQVGWSTVSLAERWQWSRGKVIRFLNELEKQEQIVQQNTNVITLITVINYDTYQTGGTADSTTNSTANDTTNEQQTNSKRYNKRTQTRINKNVKNGNNDKKEEPAEEIVLPFNTFEFITRWQQWKDYKKAQHRFTYKCAATEQAALKQLAELAGGCEWEALAIIEQSMAQGWQGLFALKNQTNNNGKSRFNNNGNGNSRITDADRVRLANDLHTAVNKGVNSQD